MFSPSTTGSQKMRSIFWIVCVLFTAQTSAQGNKGGVQFPPCSSFQGAQYYGCWDITPPGPVGSSNYYSVVITSNNQNTQYYPGWIGSGDLYSDSITPANCTIACRAHGYKFSA